MLIKEKINYFESETFIDKVIERINRKQICSAKLIEGEDTNFDTDQICLTIAEKKRIQTKDFIQRKLNEIIQIAETSLESLTCIVTDKKHPECTDELSILYTKLHSITLLSNYSNISISQRRGFNIEYSMLKESFGNAKNIKPSGKQSAKILLWSNMPNYSESQQDLNQTEF